MQWPRKTCMCARSCSKTKLMARLVMMKQQAAQLHRGVRNLVVEKAPKTLSSWIRAEQEVSQKRRTKRAAVHEWQVMYAISSCTYTLYINAPSGFWGFGVLGGIGGIGGIVEVEATTSTYRLPPQVVCAYRRLVGAAAVNSRGIDRLCASIWFGYCGSRID